jgi:hypothetical protein
VSKEEREEKFNILYEKSEELVHHKRIKLKQKSFQAIIKNLDKIEQMFEDMMENKVVFEEEKD